MEILRGLYIDHVCFQCGAKHPASQCSVTQLSREGSSDIRLPISRPVLHALVGSLNHNNSSAFHRTLFSAMFLMAFYGLFRIRELAAKNANSGGSISVA